MNDESEYLWILFGAIGPLMLVAIVLSIALAAVFYRTVEKSFLETVMFVSPFAWLGAVTGFIAGASKEVLIGALLTGVLTVAGTLISYMIGKDADAQWRKPLPLAMMLLFLCTLVGITTGTIGKTKWDDFDREYAVWLKDYEEVTRPALAARQQHQLCLNLVSEANKARCDELLLEDEDGE